MKPFEVNIVSYERPDMTQALVYQMRNTLPFEPIIRVWENSPKKYDYDKVDEVRWNRFNPSLTRVWNWAIAQSESEWIMIPSDDIKFRDGWAKHLDEEMTRYPDSYWHGPSRCFMVKRSIVEKVGWFDERLRYFCYEDLDYIRRINESGIVHRYGPLSCLQEDAMTLKAQTRRYMVEGIREDSNQAFFNTKYDDHNPEWFKGTPKFPTPNFYPFADCSQNHLTEKDVMK